jgi:hypothetical protein
MMERKNVVKTEEKQRESPDAPARDSGDSARGSAEGALSVMKGSRVRVVLPDTPKEVLVVSLSPSRW